MSEKTEKAAYTFHGEWNAGGNGYYEFFGGPDGLPTRDLTDEDIESFTDEQMEKLESELGQRLYHAAGASSKSKSSSTTKQSAGGKQVTEETDGNE